MSRWGRGPMAPLAVAGALLLIVLGLLQSAEGVPATVTVALLGGLAFAVISVSSPSAERRTVCAIFGVGLALRVGVAAFVYHWNPEFFSLDQLGYFPHGVRIAEQWHLQGSWPSLDWTVGGPANHFSEFWATWSYFVGPSELALRMLMGVIGAYGAVRTYVLAREALGPLEARTAGWLMACWPSLVVWSAQGLRDPLLFWLWCEVGLGVIRLGRGKAAEGLLGLALALYGMTLFRAYAATLAATGTCFALAVTMVGYGRSRGAGLLGVAAAGIATLLGGVGFLGAVFLPVANLETIETTRAGFQGGSTSFGEGVLRFGSWGVALLYLPLGLAYFMLAPFPWQMASAAQVSALAEQPFWYAVAAFATYGIVRLVRSRGISELALAALSLPGVLFYALAMTNTGTALRDRAQFACFVFVYSASGIVAWRARRPARTSADRATGHGTAYRVAPVATGGAQDGS